MRKFTFKYSSNLESPMYFKIFKHNLKISLAKSFIAFLTLLSLRNCHRLGNIIGRLLAVIPNRSRHVTTTNIKLCFPNMEAKQQLKLIKKSLIETSKTLVEANPMWQWKKDKLFKLIKNVHGEALFKRRLMRKRVSFLRYRISVTGSYSLYIVHQNILRPQCIKNQKYLNLMSL